MSLSIFNSKSSLKTLRNAPLAAIASVLVIVVSELAFVENTEPLTGMPLLQPTADDATIAAKMRMMRELNTAGIVAIGDSSCLMGVVPEVLEEETGTRTLNLGTLATFTLRGFSITGEECLGKPDKPQAIVLACLPRAFEVTEEQARDYSQLSRACIAYSTTTNGFSVTAEDYSSWFYRKHRVNRFPAELGGNFDQFYQRLVTEGGYLEEKRSYTKSKPIRQHFKPSSWAIDAFRSLLHRARSEEVEVFLWFSPRPTDYCSPEFLAEARSSVEALQMEFANFHLLQTTLPRWSPDCFGSESHLKGPFAVKNSQDLGKAIRFRLATNE